MFKCQREPFLKEFETEIINSRQITKEDLLNVFKESSNQLSTFCLDENNNNYYELILKDTILFPEGGGQPDDRGFIGDAKVIRVIRNGNKAIHYVQINDGVEQIAENAKVLTKIDWERRFDNMQQHSGQHLITAIADNLFGFATTSWNLGIDESFIELDTKEITEEQIKIIENEVNQKIRENIQVSVDVVELDNPKLKIARGRNLPDDVKGQIRIVTMSGVESNVCCGTHVSNLSQLQIIKLLCSVKKKGKCLLYFLCGNRVIKKLDDLYKKDTKLVELLKISSENLTKGAENLQNSLKTTRKICQNLTKDFVALEAKNFLSLIDKPKFWHYHRDNAELDFGMNLLREIGQTENTMVFITLKFEGNSGNFLLRADEKLFEKNAILDLGNKLCEILDGKGSLRGNLFQAKVFKINNVNKAIKCIKEIITE